MSQAKFLALVVEDEKSLLLAIQKKLEHAGFTTVPATDGKIALERLRNLERLPDLIWLDYYLPSMNGLEFLGEIKKDPRLKDIPVVVVSNTAGPEKVSAMMALGANKYFVKAERRLSEIIEGAKELLKKGEADA